MSRYIKRLLNQKQKGALDTKLLHFDVNTISILIMSIVAGFASYLNKNQKNPKGSRFDLFSFVAHVSSSVVAAFIADSSLKAAGVHNENVIIAVVGLAGWAGPTAMDFFAYVGRMKILTFFGYTQQANKEQFVDTSMHPQYQHTQQPTFQPTQQPVLVPPTPTAPTTPTPINQLQPAQIAPISVSSASPIQTPVQQPIAAPAVPITSVDVPIDTGREARLARKAAAQAAQQ